MSIREQMRLVFSQRAWLPFAAIIALVAGACGGDSTTPSTEGAIQVTVATTGSDPDPDGYTVLLNGGSGQAVGADGSVTFSAIQEGAHEVTLADVAANCSVDGTNPRSVSVTAEQTAQVAFDVTCSALNGDLTVTTTTTGSSIDADGFTFSVDGGTPQPIGVNESVTIEVGSGARSVELGGVANNCTVSGNNPRTVNVPGGGAASAEFSITCVSTTGTLVVTTTTTGTDIDPDGYAVTVNGGAGQAIGTTAVLTLNNTAMGDRTVELTGVADNCTVAGDNPRTVNVPQGAAVQTDFAIDCVAIVGSVEVITSTTGVDIDPDGFTVAVESATPVAIGVVDTVLVSNVHYQSRTVELQDLADNCSVVNGTNPRTLNVPENSTVSTTFVVNCVELVGTISLTTTTTGGDLDPDGYTVSIDGGPGQAVATNGTVDLTNVPAGSRSLLLSGIAANCAVTGDNPLVVDVPFNDTVDATFDVDCAAVLGDVNITTSTTGSQIDPDGYSVTVQGQAPVAIGTNDMYTAVGVSAGERTVELTGLAANCTVAGDNPRTVTVPDGGSVDTTFDVTCVAFLTNKIVFETNRDGNVEIYVMEPSGASATNLTNHLSDDKAPHVSPDGTKIAFVSDRGGSDDIWVMDADGGNPVRLTTNGATDTEPNWSPDGTQIVFSSDRDGDFEVFTMNADGSNQVQLTFQAGRDGLPDWSPDGTKIAFTTERAGGDLDIWVMDADGGNPTALTDNGTHDFGPAWSPDGSQIAFTAERDGNREIYTMDANGNNQTNRSNNAAADLVPAWSN
jgi:Tol biopolymer transport system component